MTSVIDLLVDKRLSRTAGWFDVLGVIGGAGLVVLWVFTGNLEVSLYAGLILLLLHGYISIEIINKRQDQRAEAEKIVIPYRTLVVARQYPSGSEKPHGSIVGSPTVNL